MNKCFFKLLNIVIIFNLPFQLQAIPKYQISTTLISQVLAKCNIPGMKRGVFRNKIWLTSPKSLTQLANKKDVIEDSSAVQVATQIDFDERDAPSSRKVTSKDSTPVSSKPHLLTMNLRPHQTRSPSPQNKPKIITVHPKSMLPDNDSQPSVTYFELPAGIHELRIKVADQVGNATDQEVRLRVAVRSNQWPIWWLSLWGGGFLILFILGRNHLNKRLGKSQSNLPELSLLTTDTQLGAIEKPTKSPKGAMKASEDYEETDLLKQKLHTVVVVQELYKEEDISLAAIAQKMQISDRRLSELFNRELHTSFHDYINRCRVNAFKEQVKRKDTQHLKLIALAYESGFRSKATFNRIFKKYTGLTPSQYKQMLEDVTDK